MVVKFIFVLLIASFLLTGCSKEKTDENLQPQPSRISTNIATTNTNTNTTEEIVKNATSGKDRPSFEEKEISSYQTKIMVKESGRQNNIHITCSTLNGTIVEEGEIFSFTQTVGKATKEKGYQEADVFDSDGNVTQGLGGGNCQISSTLYNAVLEGKEVGLEVVERHEHSRKVTYVPKGKDAAVAYGSVDFKFKNNTGSRIKIYAQTDDDSVSIQLVKLV